jgi:hypothetical protein
MELSIDQLIQAINKAAEEGDEETVRELGALLPRDGPSVADRRVSQAEAAAYGGAQGVSFGSSDEIIGMAGFDKDRARESLALAREQHPWTAYGTEIVGSGATGYGLARGLFTAGKLGVGLIGGALQHSPWLRRAAYPALAATEGALYGAGAAMEGDRLSGAGVGAGIGFGAGIAVPAGSAALSWTGRKVRNAFSAGDSAAQRKAMEAIQEVAQREGTSVDDVMRFLREDDTRMLADYSDRFLGQARHSTARATADTREIIQQNARNRTRQQAGVLESNVDDILGTQGTSYADEVRRLTAARRSMGDQEYSKLFQGAPDVELTPEIQALLQRPSVAKARRKGVDLAKDAPTPPQGGLIEELHWTKNQLGDMIAKAKPGTKRYANLSAARKELAGFLDDAVPGYGDVSRRYGDLKRTEQAADAGRSLLSGAKPFEALDELGALQGEEARAFVIGTKDAIRQAIRDNPGKDPSKLIPPGKWNRLESTLGKDVMQELDTVLKYEGRLWRTADALERVTADLTREAPTITRADVSAGVLGKVGLAISGMAEALRRNADKLSTREHDRIAGILAKPLSKDPAVRARELEVIERALTPIYRNHFGAAGASGVAGGLPGMLGDPRTQDNGILEE